MTARIGVITFPGSLDDRDAQRAIRVAGGEPVALWHGSHDLEGVDALVLPGGFSYGDYLRAGAIAALAPIMAEVKDAAAKGMPILGICNGFQMLVEAHLLPGGLIRNAHQQFIRRDQRLRVENASPPGPATSRGPGDRHPAQERRRRLHRRGGRARPPRGRRARRVPLRRASTRTDRCATSPASRTSAATSWASCRTPSTRSSRASAPTPPPRCARAGRPAVLHLGDRRRGRRRGEPLSDRRGAVRDRVRRIRRVRMADQTCRRAARRR